MRTARPGPFVFYYRESPIALWSKSWIPAVIPSDLGRLEADDPPLNVPGMTRVILDPLGRLTGFVAVPPRFAMSAAPGPDPDWSIALTEAGFEPGHLEPSASQWAAPVDSDRKAAWNGVISDQPDVTFHIEAAGYRGRLTYFEMQGPWVQPPRATPGNTVLLVFVAALLTLFGGVMIPTAAVLVRRNLRLGRGDRRGALRLAVFSFATGALASVFRADHTPSLIVEQALLVQIVSRGFYGALSAWLLYMALEPAVRRRWPQLLISWNRLLAGRFRDPLLGRDVLIGVLSGMAVAGLLRLDLPSVLLGREPVMLAGADRLSTLSAPRHVAYFFLWAPLAGVGLSVFFLFMLYIFHAVVRRTWLAGFLLVLFFVVPDLATEGVGVLVPTALAWAIAITVLSRVGLLAFATLMFTFLLLPIAPLTLNWSAWYAGRSFAVLGFFAALMVAAAYTSIGGKPLFGKALLDD